MQTLRSILLIVIGALAVSFAVVCFLALLPMLPFIRYLAGVCLTYSAFYLMARGTIDLRRRFISSSIVPLSEFGGYHTRRQELLHRPLALPSPPVHVTEVVEPERLSKKLTTEQEWQIIDLRTKGLSLRDIEKATSIPYNRVQALCADWEKKLKGEAVDA